MLIQKLKVPLLMQRGKMDMSMPLADAKALTERLQSSGAPVEAYLYGTGHAFFNDTRPGAYVEADAHLSCERSLSFLRTYLS